MEVTRENKYKAAYKKPKCLEQSAWAIVLYDNNVLMKKEEDHLTFPNLHDIDFTLIQKDSFNYIGNYEGHDCYCIRLYEVPELPTNMKFIDRKETTNVTGEIGLFLLVGTAHQILHWSSMNQYCGRCGHKTHDKDDERAKACENCGNIIYPRISPATITAVICDHQILLAHNCNFRKDLYSLIAGYVEPGETLEQCVKREIREEVGIEVKNIRYFGSQPWSFPDSLMVAFIADYDSGEIMVDNSEITDAGWYKIDNLPTIPSTDSIAGRIIRWFVDQEINIENIQKK